MDNFISLLGSISGSGISLEKRMATHASILAWRIPWTEEPGGCSPCGHRESNMTERLTHIYILKHDPKIWKRNNSKS